MNMRKLALAANVSHQTVLEYGRSGLLQPQWDPNAEENVFRHRDLIRLRLIHRAEKRGWSINEIKQRMPRLDP